MVVYIADLEYKSNSRDMCMDYYAVLGVSNDADKDAIKTSYRKMALKHHPDRQGGDEELFKQVSEAYSILGDDKKRKMYDDLGHNGVEMQENFDQMFSSVFEGMNLNPKSMFKEFMKNNSDKSNEGFGDMAGIAASLLGGLAGGGESKGGMGDFINMATGLAGGGGGDFAKNMFNTNDTDKDKVDQEIVLRLRDINSGVYKKIYLYNKKECEECLGLGKCEKEGGLFGSSETVCPMCFGKGKMNDPLTGEKDTLFVPPGTKNGKIIRHKKQLFRIIYKENSRYEVNGIHLKTNTTIRWVDAILGRGVRFQWIDGHMYSVHVDRPCVKPGSNILIQNMGLPKEMSTERGDLTIQVSVTFPDTIDDNMRNILCTFYSERGSETDKKVSGKTLEEKESEEEGGGGGCLIS